MPSTCQVPGCGKPVTKEGFELCYACWKDRDAFTKTPSGWTRKAAGTPPDDDDEAPDAKGGQLSSTKIGKLLGMSNRRVNLLLAELGWIEKWTKGWKVTPQGTKAGGQNRTSQSGVPYVVWPQEITQHRVLRATVADVGGGGSETERVEASKTGGQPVVEDGRLRYPAKYRAADGHYVRSRAELSIDNWLYMQGIVHAYERKLPLEEDAYCDFYLPGSKVFIEYWGMEKDPKYVARQAEKRALYKKYGLNLVELADAELENLDDNLPRLLIQFGVNCI